MSGEISLASVSSVSLAVTANNCSAKRDGNLCDQSRHVIQGGGYILGHLPPGRSYPGGRYTVTPDNSLLVQELKNLEYSDRLRALKVPNLYCGRERGDMTTSHPSAQTIVKTSKDVTGLDWLQNLKREGEFLKCCC